MKVYISGPIGGRVDQNRTAFKEAAEKVADMGYIPVVPHEIHPGEHRLGFCYPGKDASGGPEHTYTCYLLADIEELAVCDAIYCLDDWAMSPGARAEVAFAQACGITMLHVPDPS